MHTQHACAKPREQHMHIRMRKLSSNIARLGTKFTIMSLIVAGKWQPHEQQGGYTPGDDLPRGRDGDQDHTGIWSAARARICKSVCCLLIIDQRDTKAVRVTPTLH